MPDARSGTTTPAPGTDYRGSNQTSHGVKNENHRIHGKLSQERQYRLGRRKDSRRREGTGIGDPILALQRTQSPTVLRLPSLQEGRSKVRDQGRHGEAA